MNKMYDVYYTNGVCIRECVRASNPKEAIELAFGLNDDDWARRNTFGGDAPRTHRADIPWSSVTAYPSRSEVQS